MPPGPARFCITEPPLKLAIFASCPKLPPTSRRGTQRQPSLPGQRHVALGTRLVCSPTAEPFTRVQIPHLNPDLGFPGPPCSRSGLQTSPATYQHAWTEQAGGLGPEAWAEGAWETQEPGPEALWAPNNQHPHSCSRPSPNAPPRPRSPGTAPLVECATSPHRSLGVLPSRPQEGRRGKELPWERLGEGSPHTPPQRRRPLSWLSPKGPPSPPATRRSLRPSLLSPAPLSGVRARAGEGREV